MTLPGNRTIRASAETRQAMRAEAIPVTQSGTRSTCSSTAPLSARHVHTNGVHAAAPQPDARERTAREPEAPGPEAPPTGSGSRLTCAVIATALVLGKVESMDRQGRETLVPVIGAAVGSDVHARQLQAVAIAALFRVDDPA